MRNFLQIPAVTSLLLIAAIVMPASEAIAKPKELPARTVLSADRDWKFSLGDSSGAESSTFNDQAWRTVSVPHDWSIEAPPSAANKTGSGGGYFPAGIGWYRKEFTAPGNWKNKRVSLEFDGVAGEATVYLNGQKLGVHPYAYTGFRFDITSQLRLSSTNVLALRADNSLQPASRWYSGAGIYRHVRVVVTDKTHIAPWGIFVSTPMATASSAKVLIKAQLQNEGEDAKEVAIKTTLVSTSGSPAGESVTRLKLQSGQTQEIEQEVLLSQPFLWSPASPHLYRAITRVIEDGRVIDEVETPFGIRSLSWSGEAGFSLNGVPIKLAGGSVHHDNGPLGAAAFDRAEERKVQLLKAAGFNAVRTAHNPPSTAFLDACDRLGLLVLDEPFDVWTVSKRKYDYARFFHDWWQQDIDAMVKRDRNHPSIILWGIGNEIPEVWTTEGAPIAKEIAGRVRGLDSTRPLTQAFPGATFGANPDAAIAQVDIAGYNYNLAQNQAEDHTRVPTRLMMTTESFPGDAFEQWKLVHEHPYIFGEFVWTAQDYLGESGVGAWSFGEPKQAAQMGQMKAFLRTYMAKMGADGKNPMAPFQNGQPPSPIAPGFPWHAAYCGDLDLTGFRKPWSYYRDILWNGGDRVFATVRLPEPEGKKILAPGWAIYPTLPSWTWPGQEGKPLTVEIYSGTERVRLYLNDKLIGEKSSGQEQEFKADFEVPYSPGVLKAVGLRGGREVAASILKTTGAAVRLNLISDRTTLNADGQDLAFLSVEAVDEEGHLQMSSDKNIHFTLTGAGTIAAVGSGDERSLDAYSGNSFRLFNGRALVVLRTSHQPGKIKLRADTDGLAGTILTILSVPAHSMQELR